MMPIMPEIKFPREKKASKLNLFIYVKVELLSQDALNEVFSGQIYLIA
jgi:hypothetical protein